MSLRHPVLIYRLCDCRVFAYAVHSDVTCPQKSPISPPKSTVFPYTNFISTDFFTSSVWLRLSGLCIFSPLRYDMSAKEPYISAKEDYISLKKLHIKKCVYEQCVIATVGSLHIQSTLMWCVCKRAQYLRERALYCLTWTSYGVATVSRID